MGRSPRIPQDRWDAQKPRILELYKTKTLKELVAIMETKYSLDASPREYHNQFKKWGVSKYNTKARASKRQRLHAESSESDSENETRSNSSIASKNPQQTTSAVADGVLAETSRTRELSIDQDATSPAVQEFTPVAIAVTSPGLQISLQNLPWFQFQDYLDSLNARLSISSSISANTTMQDQPPAPSALSPASAKRVKRFFAKLLHATVDPDCQTYNTTIISKLHDILIEQHPGDFARHVSDLSTTNAFFQCFRYVVYLSSNNLLMLEIMDEFLEWADSSHRLPVLEQILLLQYASTQGFCYWALISAIRLRLPHLVEVLLTQVRNPNFFKPLQENAYSSTVVSALTEAVERREPDLVKIICDRGASLLERPVKARGKDPFRIACIQNYGQNNCLPIVETLLSSLGGDYFQTQKEESYRVLQNAVKLADTTILKLLLNCQDDIDYYFRYQGTALHVAVKNNRVDAAKLLIKHGADVNHPHVIDFEVPSKELGKSYTIGLVGTPLQSAIINSNVALAQVLLEAGANPNGYISENLDKLHNNTLKTLYTSFRLYDSLNRPYKSLNRPYEHLNTTYESLRGFELDVSRTPLSLAASSRNMDVLRLLLRFSVDVNKVDLLGTALRAAAGQFPPKSLRPRENNDRNNKLYTEAEMASSLSIVKELLHHGANVNGPSSTIQGRTALQAAAEWGNREVVELLLDAGALINAAPCNIGGLTALQAAVKSGDMKLVQYLVTKGAFVNAAASSENGRTCLQAAAEAGNLNLVDYLIDHGAHIDAPAAMKNGLTALQAAILNNHQPVIYRLLDMKANINMLPSYETGHTALSAALKTRNPALALDILRRNADPNIYSRENNPLSLAISTRNRRMVKLLLKAGADPNGIYCPTEETTPIQHAAAREDAAYVELLLEAGADIYGQAGLEALNSAAESGLLETVEVLLANGVHPGQPIAVMTASESSGNILTNYISGYSIANDSDANSRHEAWQPSRAIIVETAKVLIRGGADLNFDSPLMMSIYTGAAEITSALLEAKANLDQYAEGTEAYDYLNLTPLQYAIIENKLEVAMELISAGANINAPAHPQGGKTALQCACKNGNMEFLSLLISKKADLNAPAAQHNGATALQYAAMNSHMSVVSLLLQEGADPNSPPAKSGGQTALEAAITVGNMPMALLLLNHGADVNAAYNNSTALKQAAKNGRFDIAHLLLENDKDLTTLPTRRQEAGDLAESHGHWDVAEFIRNWG